jgi:hypothetical protein
MNIPLDRLYHYINDIAEDIYGDRVIIYRFWPHGSKNISDLNTLQKLKSHWFEMSSSPLMWCNDQEPLDYEYYSQHIRKKNAEWLELLRSLNLFVEPTNLDHNRNIFEKSLLLHSERRSSNLEQYHRCGRIIGVYYWSHAVIARDWFRYAEHVKQQKQVARTFLIYNRAWSNTREYRLRFAELLIDLNLQKHCKTSVNPVEPELGIHYDSHQFKNPQWRPQTVLENYFPASTAQSHYSADFDIEDYETTDIEVVLETLFDDSRLHLTEKSLRPIACGQPFMLAGTHGSLEYLRSYGFKTFGSVWDEYYDCIKDPQERLVYIASTMRHIANWTPEQRADKMAQAQAIADYNKKHFFSQEFFNLIVNELKTNLQLAFDNLNSCDNYKSWYDYNNKLIAVPEVAEFLNRNQDTNMPTKSNYDLLLQLVKSKIDNL